MTRAERLALAATGSREDARDAAQDAVVAALERGLPAHAATCFAFRKGQELVRREAARRGMQARWAEGRKTAKGLASASPEVLAERTRQAHEGKAMASALRRAEVRALASTLTWKNTNDLRRQLAALGVVLHFRTVRRYVS